MNKELAKQLKDAGFPQEKSGFVFYKLQTGDNAPHYLLRARYGLNGYTKSEVLECIDAPTLSELIEACGHQIGFILTEIDESEEPDYGQTSWTAESYNYNTTGLTPEEAVAKLWLELNKK